MEAGDVQRFCAVFAKIKARFDERSKDGLICKQGFYTHCPVVKLQRASWTNDPMDRVQNETGIFFQYGFQGRLRIDARGVAKRQRGLRATDTDAGMD